jgi:DNA-binding XRE family transcriptional regulator
MAWRIDVLSWARWGRDMAPLMQLFNIADRTVYSWKTGARSPELHEAAMLAREFGVTLDYLYLGDTSGLTQGRIAELSALGLIL